MTRLILALILLAAPALGQASRSFSGSSQYLSVADNDILDWGASQDASWFAWVNSNDDGSLQRVIHKGTSADGYMLEVVTSGTEDYMRSKIEDSGDASQITLTGSVAVIGSWSLVGFEADRSANARLYTNGTWEASSSMSTIGSVSTSAALYVGANYNATNRWMNGEIAHLVYFRGAPGGLVPDFYLTELRYCSPGRLNSVDNDATGQGNARAWWPFWGGDEGFKDHAKRHASLDLTNSSTTTSHDGPPITLCGSAPP